MPIWDRAAYQGLQIPASGGIAGGNPLARAMQSMGSGGTPAMPGPSAAPPAMPTSRLPGYSPLSDPQGPLARSGWIGALLAGNGSTREEAQMAQTGAAQQQAFAQIAKRVQSGMGPQQAIIDFVNTPEGQQFFATGNGMTDLANFMKGITPEAPETITLSPGQQALQVQGGVATPIASVPTGEVQTFTGLAELSNLSDDEKAALAAATLQKNATGDVGASEAALSRLVQTGRLTQESADLIAGGVLDVQPVLDASGATVGHVTVDKTNNQITQLPSGRGKPDQFPGPGQNGNIPGVTPGERPEDRERQDNQPYYKDIPNPADIVDSAGPLGKLQETLGAIGGVFAPQLAASDTHRKRKALANIEADAKILAKDGKVLASEMKEIGALSSTLGVLTNPIHATQTLINLHDRYGNMETKLTEIVNDPSTTADVRGQAAIELSGVKKAKANLPNRESLDAKLGVLNKQAPGQAITDAVTQGETAVDKATHPDEQAAPAQEFKTRADVERAYNAGTLKPGSIVTVAGKRYKVQDDGKGGK